MELKLVHCADFHIGASFSHIPSELAEIRKQELYSSLTDIISFCSDNAVDALVICGDLFDCPVPKKKDCEFVRKAFASVPSVSVYIVCGNHDYMCNDSPFAKENYFSDNVHIFPAFEFSFELPEKNAVFYGKSYSGKVISPSFNKLDVDRNKINILCLHGDTTAGSDYNIISKEMLSVPGINYAAFGHIHEAQLLSIGSIKAAYSGTPEPHKFNDDGKTGFIYAQITPEDTKITQLSFSKRRYHNICVDISGYSPDEIIGKIKSLISASDLYRIELTGERNEDMTINTAFIQASVADFAFYVEISDSTTVGYDFDRIENEESLRGEFLRSLRKIAAGEEEYIIAAKAGLDALSGITPSWEVLYAD